MAQSQPQPQAPKKRTRKATPPMPTLPAEVAVNAAPAEDEVDVTQEQRKADRRADDRLKSEAAMRFTVQQAQAQAQIDPEVARRAEFDARVKALAEEMGVELTTKQPKAVRTNDRLTQNGITRPAENTTCGLIWGLADAISREIHGICPIAKLNEHPQLKDVNLHTIKTQYARWRKFNNVSGRLPRLPQSVQQKVGEYDGLTAVV